MKVTITKPEVVIPPDIVNIEMTREEAVMLKNILGGIGGIGNHRNTVNRLSSALNNVGIYSNARVLDNSYVWDICPECGEKKKLEHHCGSR